MAIRVGILGSLPLFVVGIVGEILLVRSNRRYRHASPSLRRVVQFTDAALTGSLFAGVLIVANVLAFKYGERPLDFTRERAFTLESLSVKQLATLEKPVHFTVFYGRSERGVRQIDRVMQLLELYKAARPNLIDFELLNPYADRVQFEDLVRRVPDVGVAVAQGGGVLITYGQGETAENVVVRNSELFDVQANASVITDPSRFESSFHGEDALTSALIRLREGKKPRIVFTTGHGEPSIDEMEWNTNGLGRLRSRLEAVGAEVSEVNLLRDDLTPETAVVFVVAPQTPFEPREADRLKTYEATGGRLVLLLDARKTTGLEEWLKAFNVEVGTDPIVDPVYAMRGRPDLFYAPITADDIHPITDPLRNQMVAMPSATPLSVIGSGALNPAEPPKVAPNPQAQATVLFRSSPQSWAESEPKAAKLAFDPKQDRPGPLAVAIAVAGPARDGQPGTPRLVVFSSPYMADNDFVGRVPTNLDLLANVVSWLRDRPDLQGIAPKRHVALSLTVDPEMRARLVLLPTVMAFATIIGLGIATYLARRA